jgi:hypothetical protein
MTGKPIEQLHVNITSAPAQSQPEVTAESSPPTEVSLSEPVVPALNDSSSNGQAMPAIDALATDATVPVLTDATATGKQPVLKPIVTQAATQIMRGVRFLGAPFVWLIVLAFCGGTGVSAILWLTTLPPLPNCDRLHLLHTDAERLYCAEQAAKSGSPEALISGIGLIKHWTADHPEFNRSQQLMKDWSRRLMRAAYDKVTQEDLDGAIQLAKQVPPISPNYKAAQRAIVDWQRDRLQGNAIEAAIQASLKAQNWKAADTQIDDLSKIPGVYWQQRFKRLKQSLITEQIARRQLQQVRLAAESNPTDPATLGQLVAILERIAPTSYARPEAVTYLNRFRELLTTALSQRLATGNIPGAVQVAETLPQSLPLPPNARDLLGFQQSQQLATQAIPLKPLDHLAQVGISIASLRQISADSPLHPSAQSLAHQLELRVQNLAQLQIAKAIATLHQPIAYQIASNLARGIAPNQPQRLHAQTLLAQWQRERQAAEARPVLALARQLVTVKTLPNFRTAVGLAKQIPLGHPARLEAQTWIADWNPQLQALEAQVQWQQAQTFAQQDKLSEAIAAAAQIGAGQTLYAKAQAAIQTWTPQLQLAQDRPILNQAMALANQGKFEAAIKFASQIPPGRVLYEETQAAIEQWQVQLELSIAASSPSGAEDEGDPGEAANLPEN